MCVLSPEKSRNALFIALPVASRLRSSVSFRVKSELIHRTSATASASFTA